MLRKSALSFTSSPRRKLVSSHRSDILDSGLRRNDPFLKQLLTCLIVVEYLVEYIVRSGYIAPSFPIKEERQFLIESKE